MNCHKPLAARDHAAIRAKVVSSLFRIRNTGRVFALPALSFTEPPEIDDQQLRLGHILDRIAQTFTPDAGIFDAAVGHVVPHERWESRSNQNSADLQLLEGLKMRPMLVVKIPACSP